MSSKQRKDAPVSKKDGYKKPIKNGEILSVTKRQAERITLEFLRQ
jgi:hypothetical protein